MAESGTIIDDFSKYNVFKVEGNKYFVYGIFTVIIIFIAYFVIVYKSPKPFEKGKTVRWVVTGDDIGPADKRKTVYYSYDGVDYIEGEDDFLFMTEGAGYGRSYDNENFFWIVGGMPNPLDFNSNRSSMVNSYNGYTWIDNENPLQVTKSVLFALDSNQQPLWLATGAVKEEFEGKSNIIFSNNGVCWSHSKGMCFQGTGWGMAYGNSMYVAGGEDNRGGNYNILYSYGGLSWQLSGGASFTGSGGKINYCRRIDYGLSSDKATRLWVAVGYTDSQTNILYSLDGINWNFSTGLSFDGVGQGGGVAFGLDENDNPIWVATGQGEHSILYSENGQHWVQSSGLSFIRGYNVAYGKDSNDDNFWIAVGDDLNGENDEILYSYTGRNWFSTGDDAFGMSVARGVASNVLKYGVKPFI